MELQANHANTQLEYNDYGKQYTPQIVYDIPKTDNPPCIYDGNPTQRTGSCYTCLICGATTSCG